MPRIPVTLFTDPGCPFGYSASPSIARLRWRFAGVLDWRLAMIGLAETPEQYEARGYTALDMALGWRDFRQYGMPLVPAAKERVAATSRACRAIVAVRLQRPGSEWAALKALQLAQFTSPRLIDDDGTIEDALASVPGLDAPAAVRAIDDADVLEAYEDDRAAARTAAGTAAAAQSKTAATDGPERFTAPTLMVDEELIAGGFQPYAAYDVLLANLDPQLERRDPPDDVAEAVAAFPEGLTTAEVAAVMTPGVQEPDMDAAEAALIEAEAGGRLSRAPVGDRSLWGAAEEGLLTLTRL